jgi:hypothetical protein
MKACSLPGWNRLNEPQSQLPLLVRFRGARAQQADRSHLDVWTKLLAHRNVWATRECKRHLSAWREISADKAGRITVSRSLY